MVPPRLPSVCLGAKIHEKSVKIASGRLGVVLGWYMAQKVAFLRNNGAFVQARAKNVAPEHNCSSNIIKNRSGRLGVVLE